MAGADLLDPSERPVEVGEIGRSPMVLKPTPAIRSSSISAAQPVKPALDRLVGGLARVQARQDLPPCRPGLVLAAVLERPDAEGVPGLGVVGAQARRLW